MIKLTRRTLDTCGCRVVYQWDSDLPAEQHVHIVTNYEYKCPAHAGLLIDDQDLYDNVVCKENGKKNSSIDLLLQNAPASAFDINADGNRVFKKGISVTWSWAGIAPDRIFTIIITGITLTTNQINAVKAKLDSKFGIDKVDIING